MSRLPGAQPWRTCTSNDSRATRHGKTDGGQSVRVGVGGATRLRARATGGPTSPVVPDGTSLGTVRRNIARRLWDQREELREAYEVKHGSDQDGWQHRHPGIVLTAVPSIAHAACLGCLWLDVRGHWMGHSDLARTSLCMAALTPSLQRCIPGPAPRSRCHHLRRGGCTSTCKPVNPLTCGDGLENPSRYAVSPQ
jgi:hypothetical protein